MHLRNKKTGEIVDVYNIYISKRVEDDSLTSHENVIRSFDSIAELNEEWEDYNPTEPYIKDEKIRKLVKAWIDNLRDVMIDGAITFYVDTSFCTFQVDIWKNNNKSESDVVALDLIFDYDGLEDSVTYTADELCGEEEE